MATIPTSKEDLNGRLGLGSKTKGAKRSHDADDLSSADLYLMYYKQSNLFGSRVNSGKQVTTVSNKGMVKLYFGELGQESQTIVLRMA